MLSDVEKGKLIMNTFIDTSKEYERIVLDRVTSFGRKSLGLG